MSIIFDEKTKIFYLESKNSSYIFQISEIGHLLHLHYGNRIANDDISYLYKETPVRTGFCTVPYGSPNTYSLSSLPQEFSTDGVGDCRYSSVIIKNNDGSTAFDGRYVSHKIYSGKYKLDGLPSIFASENDTVDTLEVVLQDPATQVSVELLYSVYEQKDIITRAVKVINNGKKIRLSKIMSVNIDFMHDRFDLVHFQGHHYLERLTEREKVTHSAHEISSSSGTTSHAHNPAVVLCSNVATEDSGDCYGFALLYTGNFVCNVQADQFSQTRFAMGINPDKFEFILDKGDCFTAPEVIMSFSSEGFSKMTHSFHDAFRENACKSKYMKIRRPVLVNNWEATRFDFDGKKIIDIARASKALGVDLFVLDDGWFGARNGANAGLGDWQINEQKLGGTLADVIKQINDMGLKFGLWFEPEMINEDSDLYRAHPDWALKIPGRDPALGRGQLVLDITRKDVRDHLVNAVNTILDNHNIEYVKWDFNRYLSDVYSLSVDAEHQGELYHRFVLGFYDMLDRIILSHPDILFEGCSGGGGRFDGGMLCYQPQVWCSDDTDAVWRLKIQYGTSFLYPCSAMGAHVSVCPNKKTGRVVPIETRAKVAMSGTFGYELDTTKMTEDEIKICAKETELFNKYYDIITFGDYYRLTSPFENDRHTAWQHISKDKSECLVTVVMTESYPIDMQQFVYPKALDKNAVYELPDGKRLHGSTLMNVGISIPLFASQYQSFQFYIKKVKGE